MSQTSRGNRIAKLKKKNSPRYFKLRVCVNGLFIRLKYQNHLMTLLNLAVHFHFRVSIESQFHNPDSLRNFDASQPGTRAIQSRSGNKSQIFGLSCTVRIQLTDQLIKQAAFRLIKKKLCFVREQF